MGTRVTRADPVPREETSPAAGRRESIWQFGLVGDYRAIRIMYTVVASSHVLCHTCATATNN